MDSFRDKIVPVTSIIAGVVVVWYVFAVILNAPFQRDLDRRAGETPGVVEFIGKTMSQPKPTLPAPHQVAVNFFENTFLRSVTSNRSLVYNAWVTLSSTLLGFAFGTALGIVIAVGIVHVATLDRSLMPWIIASQTIPILAVAPMIIVVLAAIGVTGLIPKALISTYLSFFPVAVGMVKGLRSPELTHLDLMHTYNASPSQTFWKLRVPASVPFLFTSMKVAVAASLVGARHMTGLDNAVVSDIGGTTTDVAVLDQGRPRLDPEGATVGGFRTMVEAVAMRTFGLGGDSEVALEDGVLSPRILLGPRRLVPLALAGMVHGEAVTSELERQLRAPNPGRMDGRFAVRTGVPERLAAGLTAPEARLYEAIGSVPLALDRLLTSNAQNATLNRLVSRGLVHISGFTPSDAAHVLGKQANWDAATARLGAELFARKRDGRGQFIAATPEAISERVLLTLTRWSAEYILETAFAEDGLDGAATVAHALVQRAVDAHPGIARLSVALDRPVIGLGASAPLHYAGLAELVGNGCVVPEDTDVANALGAVVGQVRVSAEARVSQPKEGLFRVASGETVRDFVDEAVAIAAAETDVRAIAAGRARDAGTDSAEIEIASEFRVSTVEGQRMFIEAHVVAVASGRPRIAV
ncbi:MAG: ABC transporter permease subunit [Mesorhizobium sp.]|nr:MAG: ABC transporter permease subunit [Mesorhizobium sp.]